MYRSLLVPLDGSTFGEHALPLALSIARRAGAGLQVVHVHSPLEATYAPDGVFFDEGLDARLKQTEQAYLDGIVKRLAGVASVPVTSALLEGSDIAACLREAANGAGVDLVVMTTHGRGALGRFWLGSVADRLVRDLPMPLLLARPENAAPDFGREAVMKHMLLPLDGSPFAEQMLEPAVALGSVMDADYTLLRVITPVWPGTYDYYGASLGEEAQSFLRQIEKAQEQLHMEAEEYLHRVAGRLRERSLRVQTQVGVADQPAVAILKEANAPAINLVALETHGRRGLSRLFLGSVADKVIRGASLPVLVHRPPSAGST
jgi:nucleotide-binding universal stress UspA family protein